MCNWIRNSPDLDAKQNSKSFGNFRKRILEVRRRGRETGAGTGIDASRESAHTHTIGPDALISWPTCRFKYFRNVATSSSDPPSCHALVRVDNFVFSSTDNRLDIQSNKMGLTEFQ